MELEELADYLLSFLPFPLPRKSLEEFLLLDKEHPPPYSLTEVKLVQRKGKTKVVETTPYSWVLLFEEIRESVRSKGEIYLEERHSLGWFLYLLHQYKPKKIILGSGKKKN